MHMVKTFDKRLALAALVVVAAALGLLLFLGSVDDDGISLPVPGEATEATAEKIWEQLSAAIQHDDNKEAKRLATWLDERLKTQGRDLTLPYSRIVQLWCKMGGHGYDFCEEEAQ